MNTPLARFHRIMRYVFDRLHYIRLTALLQDNLGKPAPELSTVLNFNEARDDGVAVALAGPHANHLHLAPDR